MDDLRSQLNQKTFVVEANTDLSAKVELLCELLGIKVCPRKPLKGQAESYPHWAVLADPIRTSSAVELLCSGCLDEDCIVVAEAPHYWAVRNRPDTEILVLDSDLFPDKSIGALANLDHDSEEEHPGTELGESDDEKWMPENFTRWTKQVAAPPLKKSKVKLLSPREFQDQWPDDERIIVAMPQVGLENEIGASPNILKYSARYFCSVARAAREFWMKDKLREMQRSINYQYTACYGGSGGNSSAVEAEHALYSLIERGMRISVPKELDSGKFVVLPQSTHPSSQRTPSYDQ